MVTWDNEIITRIKEFMLDKDYFEFADSRRDNKIEEMIFHHKTYGFSCVIKPHNDPACVTFELIHTIIPGAFLLTSNECGSLFNLKHFREQEKYMKKFITILGGEYGRT